MNPGEYQRKRSQLKWRARIGLAIALVGVWIPILGWIPAYFAWTRLNVKSRERLTELDEEFHSETDGQASDVSPA